MAFSRASDHELFDRLTIMKQIIPEIAIASGLPCSTIMKQIIPELSDEAGKMIELLGQ
ncbi:hypothetical protein ACFL0S_00735 [Thermodesulfobacteriota bacterium]